ncbi:hypothetical protein JK635_03520 [Neobacillus sp. YIM B02564]|uniref:Sortilin N-terminal domain-containing protein n=1 Tax=Neobacillus paridis TaxID=2803862 RepID=A0ABS1TLY7_9BACI|nr:hypothetical protein [Neobacillus paridis]MBL4951311.1 hypothetical protein [Neobacillus paridis]
MKKSLLFSLISIVLLIAAGCTNKSGQDSKPAGGNYAKAKVNYEIKETKAFKLNRIYGIGYPGNDTGLYLASNQGLIIYRAGKWFESTANRHQYIGFQAVNTGFIASGHPQKGTGYKDPLGIMKSNNKGKSMEPVAFYGKANFHFLAAGYAGPDIYMINEKPLEQLSQGVNYSKDNGQNWQVSKLKGFQADSLGMIAVHPEKGDIIAMATRSGIYYSTDNGDTMKLVTDPFMVTAVTFLGDSLLFSSVEENKILLKRLDPVTGNQTTLSFPFLDYDNPITYLAVNPKNKKQIAFSTYKNDVYESVDGGEKWINLLSNGKKELE